ncbi:Fe(2+) transporter FeoB [subsurface metagenome]
MSREDIIKAKNKSINHLRGIFGDGAEAVIAGERYGFIGGLLKDTLKKPKVEKATTSDKVDKVLVHRVWGIPIFLAIMYGVFQFVFTASAPLMGLIDAGFGSLAEMVAGVSPAWWGSLLSNGIIGGVGSVLIFAPPIFLLFVAISILEDCGYLARAAFVMDRAMHKIGLHGRSFIPMILGFGCTIPAIMACRTVENPKDRMTTMLVTPFMSCGARLPIFVLLAGFFFPTDAGLVVFAMYMIGIGVAILSALLFRKRLFRGESGHFVMELPPYRLPTFISVVTHMWERGRLFLRRAGTIIFAVVIVVWVLASLPWGVEYASAGSALGQMGSAIAPVFIPCGFGQWPAAASLVFGFLAKEVVVGSMGAIFAVGEGGLGGALVTQLGWTPLIAFAFMVFSLLYVPCVAAMGTIRSETNSWKWFWFSIIYTTGVAWIAATLKNQIGRVVIGG